MGRTKKDGSKDSHVQVSPEAHETWKELAGTLGLTFDEALKWLLEHAKTTPEMQHALRGLKLKRRAKEEK